jgi:hypothetical protein
MNQHIYNSNIHNNYGGENDQRLMNFLCYFFTFDFKTSERILDKI